MAVILIIDDDASLLDMLSLAFEDGGYDVVTASDGARGLAAIAKGQPDAVVSDVNMPGVDGFSLCRKLRAAKNGVPVILLTSRDSEIDEALGLELGADDYISKPFSTRILLARVAALLRREQLRDSVVAPGGVVKVGDLALDAQRIAATYRKTVFPVTVTEFRLLEVLASAPGLVFSRDQLLHRIRGDESVVADRIIDTYVRRLRRKIEEIDPSFQMIETVVGAGYRWKTND